MLEGQQEKDRRRKTITKIEMKRKKNTNTKVCTQGRRILEVSFPSGQVWAICAFLLDKPALAKFLYGGKKGKKGKKKGKKNYSTAPQSFNFLLRT